ncbi:hypothetical protein B0A49_07755 [Cryomyces minteri]|uniref:Annexin n=1 Tax=Cryomyces minteri TaxID=331657 RepID=A0A4U0XDH7_9PEZI|nr:hypothetical protein B0A49_07755 [Cryomyces minteri]
MSYYPPPGPGYPPYQGHSPQPGYGAPPPGPPPPQGYPPYPPQQPYGHPPPMQNQPPYPPQGGYTPQGGYPPQGYPPQQQLYGAPPPPQGHSPYPPQGGYPPPQQPYGAPPQQAPYPPQGPPPSQYGAPPPQQPYGAPTPYMQPTPPSPGYITGQVAPVDMSREAEGVRAAMKGLGTNEKQLIAILSRLDPVQMNALRNTYHTRFMRDLLNDLEKETSGYFRDGLMALARGPLGQDVYNVHKAIKGLGTKEAILNDVLLSRSNADLNAIKLEYQRVYRKPLEADVAGDLSMKTERLFSMVLAARRAEESTPVNPADIERDITELYRATEARTAGTDQVAVCQILASHSDGQIRALSQAYAAKYQRPLAAVLAKNFTGHMEAALASMLRAAEDRAKHDADLLEAAMKGMGTKDDLLVNRVVRCHWNRAHMQQVKAAYKHFYKTELARRIEGETRGDYEKLMLACIA